MLRQLRIRLTLLYLFASIFLSLAVGGGTYTLVNYYFRTTNDQALWVKMGLQFGAYGIPLPLDLYETVKREGLVITNPIRQSDSSHYDIDTHEDDKYSEEDAEGLQESELADIYVLPLTRNGTLIPGLAVQDSSLTVNMDAVNAALKNGYDFRTVNTPDGRSIRLFTYPVPKDETIEVFQIGRFLLEQQRVLRQLLNTMIFLGGLVTILFGVASWILAGRTIKPSQQAWDKQQNFIANASHELRAPLTLIHAGVELSLRKAESKGQKEILSDVLSDANYMNKLIEDLLLLSRLDSNTLKLEIQPINIIEFTPELLRQVERVAQNRSISFVHTIKQISLFADPIRLKQILLIILDNAIRNTEPGGTVSMDVDHSSDKGVITISDNGSGIPPDLIDKVFDRFFKVNDQSSLDYRGSGLGLSIAKSLVESQNGKIKIHSKCEKGTQVILEFPLSS